MNYIKYPLPYFHKKMEPLAYYMLSVEAIVISLNADTHIKSLLIQVREYGVCTCPEKSLTTIF